MGKASGIQWTDNTFNPWWGCDKVSAGCKHCYAETFAARPIHVLPTGGKGSLPIWGADTPRRFFGDAHWRQPVLWNRAAEKAGVRTKVFCASMADVFEDRRDLDGERVRLFSLIDVTPWLDWQLLTKRPQNMTRLAPLRWADAWPSNAWAGCTVENQEEAGRRMPHLMKVPAAVRFISMEPLLGPVDLHCYVPNSGGEMMPAVLAIDWIIVGGESGKDARSFDLAWAESLITQADAVGCHLFLKQLGSAPVAEIQGENHRRTWLKLSDPHGGEEHEWPEHLRGHRAFPVPQ